MTPLYARSPEIPTVGAHGNPRTSSSPVTRGAFATGRCVRPGGPCSEKTECRAWRAGPRNASCGRSRPWRDGGVRGRAIRQGLRLQRRAVLASAEGGAGDRAEAARARRSGPCLLGRSLHAGRPRPRAGGAAEREDPAGRVLGRASAGVADSGSRRPQTCHTPEWWQRARAGVADSGSPRPQSCHTRGGGAAHSRGVADSGSPGPQDLPHARIAAPRTRGSRTCARFPRCA